MGIIEQLDIFGTPVGVHYQGNRKYRTKVGALISLIALLLIGYNLATLSLNYYTR